VKPGGLEALPAPVRFWLAVALIYPLLPDVSLYGVSPKDVWFMVVLISTVNSAGYLLLRLIGKGGVLVAGLLGGLVSSTPTAVSLSSISKKNSAIVRECAGGIVGASAVMFLRVLLLTAVLNAKLARVLSAPTVFSFLLGAVFLKRLSASVARDARLSVKNPYEISTVVNFALLYALVLLVSKKAVGVAGSYGVVAVSAVAGVTDVDAITLSVSRMASGLEVGVVPGAVAILTASTVNTVFKWFLTLYLGTKELFRAVTPGFALILAGEVLGVLLVATLC